jgi:DNA methyltransferase 1-associated protein 1
MRKVGLVLAELGVPSRPMPTEAVCAAYDKLRQDILKVLTLQKLLVRRQASLATGIREDAVAADGGGGCLKTAGAVSGESEGNAGALLQPEKLSMRQSQKRKQAQKAATTTKRRRR